MIPPSSFPRAAKSGCAAAIRGSIAPTSATCAPRPATSCTVRSPRGRTLGSALFSDRSQIALRMLTLRRAAVPTTALIRRRIEAAIAFRESLAIDATAYRLVHGEADLLPSLIVDRYGDYLVVQALSQGMDRLLPAVVATLERAAAAARHPGAQRSAGARCSKGSSSGSTCWPARCPEPSTVTETGIEYDVDLRHGQKTGLFLDQRENRAAAARVRARPAARLLQLQRRLRAGARRAAATRRSRSTSPRTRSRACAQNAARNGVADRRARRQRVRRAARARAARRAVRHDRARPAGVRQEQGGGRQGARRLQGDQPARAEAAQAGRHARDLQLLVQRQRGGVRRDRLRSGASTRRRTSRSSRSGCRAAIIRCCSACRRPTT